VLLELADQDADALLTSAVTGPLDARVHEQLLREAHGNPLALLELPRGPAAAELSFGSWSREPMSVASRVEQGFVRQVERLPDPTRLLLLTAAAEPTGDRLLLWRAAERLEIPLQAGVSAEEAGLDRDA
jgi:hypothetical protein